MLTVLIAVFVSGLLVNVNGDQCGFRNCKAGQVCESNVDGGTCYNSSSRVECNDGISYCYRPRQCCGVSTCCPENSECCGFSTCCPKNSVCCSPNYCCEHGTTCCGFQTCCASGSYCDGGMCKSRSYSGPFRWWYIFFFLAPMFAVIGVIVRRRRRAVMLRAAGVNSGVVIAVPVQTREQYGYDQGPINYNMQPASVPPYTPQSTDNPSAPPPPYSDVAPRQA